MLISVERVSQKLFLHRQHMVSDPAERIEMSPHKMIITDSIVARDAVKKR